MLFKKFGGNFEKILKKIEKIFRKIGEIIMDYKEKFLYRKKIVKKFLEYLIETNFLEIFGKFFV